MEPSTSSPPRPQYLCAPNIAAMLRLPAAVTIVTLLGVFALIRGPAALWSVFGSIPSAGALFVAYVASAPVHERLHIIGYRWIGRVAPSATRIVWFGLIGVAECHAPMRVWPYRWSIALPGLVLGVVPFVIGLVAGEPWPSAFGAFCIGAAMADVRVLWTIRRLPAAASIEMQPRLGAFVILGS